MWKGFGNQVGLEILQVSDEGFEKLPKEQYGHFFSGNCYVILYTIEPGKWNIHFWLGKETAVDEKKAAATKASELGEALDGSSVQYQEHQDHETSIFVSYFKFGIRYMQGFSGGDKLDSSKPRLYQCKGKRNVRCSQVACEHDSLNLGDVFILDCELDLYVWMPPESGRLERIKGMSQAKSIRDEERNGKPKVHVLDLDWNKNDAFWKIMGGKQNVSKLKSAEAGGADENFWRTNKQQITLWRVCDESGKIEVTKISEGDFKYDQLESKDAFILDASNGGVYVWIGKGCTKEERAKAVNWANDYIDIQGKPEWTQVIRVMEGAEPASFTQWSTSWQDGNAAYGFQPKLFQCSDESGKLSIEEIANFTQEDLDGDDVMILDGLNVIYVWVGSGANVSEKKHATATAQKYLDTDSIPRKETATIETIFQSSEPVIFKKYFPAWNDKLFKQDERSVENMRKLMFT